MLRVVLIAVGAVVRAHGACICDNDVTAFPGMVAADKDYVGVSPEAAVSAAGDSIGKLVQVGGMLLTQQTFAGKKSTSSAGSDCPAGYRLPTVAEMEAVMATPDVNGENVVTSASYLGMTEGLFYMTSTKTHPGVTGGGDAQAWQFEAVKINAGVPEIVTFSTYFTKEEEIKAHCVQVPAGAAITLEGWPGQVLAEGQSYPLRITNRNVVKAHFFDSVTARDVQETSWDYSPAFEDAHACGTLTVSAQLFGGDVVSRCYVYWKEGAAGVTAGAPYFDVRTDVRHVTYGADAHAQRQMRLHFTAGTAPLAPHPTEAYSFIFFAAKDTGMLKVKQVGLEGEEMGTTDVGEVGRPFDIHVRPWGVVLLYAGEVKNSLFVRGVNTDGSVRFHTVIMNNGPDADKLDAAKEQVDVGSLPFGIKIMYNPHNGRLASYGGMIAVEFAHYNLFGPGDGHTGDTLLFFDENTGDYMKMAWAWGTSHSLEQRLITVGGRMAEVALGDAYPQHFNHHIVNVEDCCSAPSKQIVPGTVPANGGGKSLGRLGGLSSFDDDFIVTYARRSGTSGFGGDTFTNDAGELGMVRYGLDMNLLQHDVFLKSEVVNTVKSARLGDHLVIGYALSQRGADGLFLSASVADDDEMYMLLVDKRGNVLQSIVQREATSLSNNDDWEVLSDGRVAWTHVDKDGQLNYYWLEIPPNPPLPNMMKTDAPPTAVPTTPTPPTPLPATSAPPQTPRPATTTNAPGGTPSPTATNAPATGAPASATNQPSAGAAATGVPMTGTPTTGAPTTGVPTTGEPTTGDPAVAGSTGLPTTGVPSTGVPTTGVPVPAPDGGASTTTPAPAGPVGAADDDDDGPGALLWVLVVLATTACCCCVLLAGFIWRRRAAEQRFDAVRGEEVEQVGFASLEVTPRKASVLSGGVSSRQAPLGSSLNSSTSIVAGSTLKESRPSSNPLAGGLLSPSLGTATHGSASLGAIANAARTPLKEEFIF